MPKAPNSRDRLTAIARPLTRDPFTTFLLFASIGLTLAFLLLLGSTRPRSEGERTAISEVQELAADREIERATILDYDDRVVAHLRDGPTVWAAYPSADGQAETCWPPSSAAVLWSTSTRRPARTYGA